MLKYLIGSLISISALQTWASPKTFVVTFKAKPSAQKLAQWAKVGAEVERLTPYKSEFFERTYRVSAEATLVASLGKDSNVQNLDEVFNVDLQSLPAPEGKDPLFAEQWYLQNQGFPVRYDISDIKSDVREGLAGEDLGWATVRNILASKFLKAPVVAIIDTGVDYEHPELKDAILLNDVECDKGEIPLGDAKEDRDKNGYKGDCKGINLTSKAAAQVNRPLDKQGHGTHLAGLVAAKAGNDWGISGISDQIKILPIKAYAGSEKRVAISDRIAEAILYAVARKVDVINLSVGYPIAYDAAYIREAVAEASKQGVVIVAAAGNNGHNVPVFPCAYETVICVSASQNDGKLADFSNFGAHVDIMAPGDFILSTYPMTIVPSYSMRGFELISGTSQASPLVAGIFAVTKGLFPSETLLQLKARVLGSRDENKKIRLDRIVQQTTESGAKVVRESARLLFKDTSVIEIMDGGRFTLPVKFENLGSTPVSIQLHATSVEKHHLVTSGSQTMHLTSGEVAAFNIEGQLQTQTSPLVGAIEVRWTGTRGEHREILNFFLARKIDNEANVQRLPIAGTKDVKFIASAGSLNQVFAGDLFISFERVEKVDGLQLKTWKRGKLGISQVGQSQLSRLTGILGYYQADVNGDGQTDLLVMGQTKVSDDDIQLIIYYLKEDLVPLIPGDGSLVLSDLLFEYPKIANASEAKWHLVNHPKLGKILMPAMIIKSYVPEVDLSLVEKRQRLKYKNKGAYLPHLVYLEPTEIAGQMVLRTRVYDTEAVKSGWRGQLGLDFYDDVDPKFSLSNGDFIFSAGSLNHAKPLRVRWNTTGGGFESTPLQWPEAFSGYRTINVSGDGPIADRVGLIGLISKSRAHIVIFNDLQLSEVQQSLVVDLPDESEYFIRPLLVAQSKVGYRVVAETGQNLFGFAFDLKGKQLMVQQNQLARSTFYGDVLTQVTWPVLMADGSYQIYVDDTQINARYVWLKSFSMSDGFSSRSDLSFTLSKNCRTLNPARWDGENFTRIQALCQTETGLELLSLPLTQ